MNLTAEQEARVLRFTLDYAAKRWPHANRVTMPELMRALDEDKERLRKLELKLKGGEKHGEKAQIRAARRVR